MAERPSRTLFVLSLIVTVLAAPGLDDLVSQQQNAPGSFGSEFSELEGFGSAAMF